MKSVAVSCTDVHKRYGKRVALDGLTINVPQGRMVGVLGPNGAGKSTWFRTLTGLTKPDAGDVRVLDAVPGWRTNAAIAYLPDRARWYPGHTVGDALNWGAALLPHFDRERSLQMAEMMDLDPNQPVDGLSRGFEARLMLILCLARRVPLLILDEPLSGIDMISREQIIEALVAAISDQETTLLLSTHEVSDAESLFDHVLFLQSGRVVLQGDADGLRRQYGSMRDIMRNLYQEGIHR